MKQDSPPPQKTQKKKPTAVDKQEPRKASFTHKMRALRTRSKILISIGLASIVGIAAFSIPSTKFAVLNATGSADASLYVTNSVTSEPVKGAVVTLTNGDSATSDDEGRAFFNDTNYGKTQATITKSSYSVVVVDLIVSKDDIQLGTFQVEPLGIPVAVEASDWLTQSAVLDYTITSSDGESVFQSDDGVAQLNIPFEASDKISFTVSSERYTDYSLIVDTQDINRTPRDASDASTLTVELVLAGKHYFVSNRDNAVGYYAVNYDGSDTELLVSTEKDLDFFDSYPIEGSDDTYAALLPSNLSEQYLQDQLAIVKPTERSLKIVDEVVNEDLDFDVVAVKGNLVIYRVAYEKDRADKYKLKSYDLNSGKLTTYFTSPNSFWPHYAEEFNDVYLKETTDKKRYNQLSGYYQYQNNLVKINLESGNKSVIVKDAFISLNGTDHNRPDKLLYNVIEDRSRTYYSMDLADNSKTEKFDEYPEAEDVEEIPDSEKGQASPEGTNRVWVDQRDGKNTLILNSSDNSIDGKASELSVSSIIRWIDETKLTLTASDGTETADYIVDVETGNFKKITNSFRSTYHYY